MQTAVDVIRRIAAQNNLSFLNFDVYRPRGWRDGTTKHFKDEKAAGQKRDPASAIEHSPPNGLFSLNYGDMAGETLDQIINMRPEQSAVQVLSPTMRGAEIFHIPMLDVEFPPSDENLSYLLQCLKALGQEKGAVLLSGASYHYYGYRMLSPESWQQFMYRSLLLDEVVDTRWVAHRLIDGHARLRITRKQDRNFVPYVVTEL